MKTLYDFVPMYCPSCGEPTGFRSLAQNKFSIDDNLRRTYNGMIREFIESRVSYACHECQMKFQYAPTDTILKAADDAGGDME
jgi:transposase-like protein